MRLKGFRLPFNTVEAAEHIATDLRKAKRPEFNSFGADKVEKKQLSDREMEKLDRELNYQRKRLEISKIHNELKRQKNMQLHI